MSDTAATVSVVMRTKDRPELLPRALKSVVSQQMDGVELIVVNDGGDPNVVRHALAKAELGDVTVKEIHNEQSHGRSGALNDGFAAASGKYIVIHDDDDSWEPDFLRVTTEHLNAHPNEVAVATATTVVNETIENGEITEVGRERLAAELTQIYLMDVARSNSVPPIAMLIRAEAAIKAGEFDTTIDTLEDWDFFLRLLLLGPMGYLHDVPRANWHHRKAATGPLGNSIFVEETGHRASDKVIRDKYLRSHAVLGPLLANAEFTNATVRLVNKRLDALVDHIEVLTARQNDLISALDLKVAERHTHTLTELSRQLEHVGQDAQWARIHTAGVEHELERRPGRSIRRIVDGVARRIDPETAPASLATPAHIPLENVSGVAVDGDAARETAQANAAGGHTDDVLLPEPEQIPSHESRWLD